MSSVFRTDRHATRFDFPAAQGSYLAVVLHSYLCSAGWEAEIELIGSRVKIGTDCPDEISNALLDMARRRVADDTPRPDLESGQEIFTGLRRP